MHASRAKGWKNRATAGLVWFHRWLGIATCLIFALWFASGAVLLLVPFPSLPAAAQHELARPVDFDAVRITPARALSIAGPNAADLRLIERAGRPAWIAQGSEGMIAIDAVDGQRLANLDARQARSEAVASTGDAGVKIVGPFDYDQWIVHNHFDPWRPVFRVDLSDRQETELYLSARTGEFLQRTTAWQRGWNWVGAVLHWVYFTPLRSHFSVWDQSIWWLSLVAMLVAVAGITLGVIRTLAVRRVGRGGFTYFRPRWLRWHHLTGLVVSLFVFTWIVSGWLSMDHGRLFSRGDASAADIAHFAGCPLPRTGGAVDLQRLASRGPIKSAALRSIDCTPLWSVVTGAGNVEVLDAQGHAVASQDRDALVRTALAATWPGVRVSRGEAVDPNGVYALNEGWPPSARRYSIDGAERFDVYVDSDDMRVLTVMNDSRAAYAWAYYALHSFNFPGLATHQWLRKTLVLILMGLGFAFSVTGVVVGWQRLRKSFRTT